MTDQTPRVPDLWWSASEKALWEKDDDGYFCPDYYPIKGSKELPADAVKLGDVEELKRELDDSLRRYWGLRDKLADIREALVNHAAHAAPYSLLNAIHEIVERETR